jgi:hypothetical protein
MPNIKKHILFSIVLLSTIINNSNAQSSYCIPINTQNNNEFFISKVSFGDLFQNSNNTAAVYEYYNTLSTSTDVYLGQNYATSIRYNASNYNASTLKVWIDFNRDGDFSDEGEVVYSNTVTEPFSEDGIIKNFQINIPSTAKTGKTRMRVAINRNNLSSACSAENQVGETEDYDIYIKDVPEAPIAKSINSIDVNLDVLGNATISAEDINNGSYDAYDTPNGIDLTLSLDKSNFDCNDVSTPSTTTLTVTDSDGLKATSTTTVNVKPYTGNFVTPTLEDITEYCSYTAVTPIMNLNCTQEITATTKDPISFKTPGNYKIDWVFYNGITTNTSTQNITIKNPATPTISITNISETTAIVRWESEDEGPFIIQYRLKGTTDWNETTSSLKYKKITGLDDGLEYDVQVKTATTCSNDFTGIITFTTVEVQYCNENVDVTKDNRYYISNVKIGNINNSSDKNADVYKYYQNVSTTITAGETFSGEITYTKDPYNDTFVTVWIDYNNNGDFSDSEDKVFSTSNLGSGNSNSVFNIELTDILVPETATLGKTRLRVSIKHTSAPTSACNFGSQAGEIEDYDIYIGPTDNTAFESAIITQVLHYETTERWIEVTNTNTTETIPANKVALALFKNVSGDLSGVKPTSTFFINAEIAPGASVLLKNPSSKITALNGLSIEEAAITDFGDDNDIIITTKKIDATAWENRYDVVTSIKSNTSLVRIDEVLKPNKNYDSEEWVAFIDDDIATYQSGSGADIISTRRHPQAPLISEILNSSKEANTLLGLHRIGKTTTNSAETLPLWDNGYPDRSRYVQIDENYNHINNKLSARKLEVDVSKELTVTDNLLVINNDIKLDGNIRLLGNSQLVQTHTNSTKITGNGKLFVNQESEVPSKYRYNYMSSPVTTIGENTYTLETVFKDGTNANEPKEIDFVSGYDGSYNEGLLKLADYWIYTYAAGSNGRSNWEHKYKNGTINKGDGYIFKGPGQVQNYTFVGTPNDGSFTTVNEINNGESYLIGNPFPSAMNARKFIQDNINTTTGTLYFWQHVGEEVANGTAGHNFGGYIGGYASQNKDMSTNAYVANSNDPIEILLETEEAEHNGLIINSGTISAVSLNEDDYLKINNISNGIDTLKITYASTSDKVLKLKVNDIEKGNITFTNTNNYYIDKVFTLCVVAGSDITLTSTNDQSSIKIDKITLLNKNGEIECAPSTGGISYADKYKAPEPYIAIGQGFFVEGSNTKGKIIFNNSQREYITKESGESVFFKSDNKKTTEKTSSSSTPILKLGMNYSNEVGNNYHRQIGISFNPENSFDYDKGSDSEMYDMNSTDFYWKFPNDYRNYVIAGVQEISNELEIPLEIVISKNSVITIRVDEESNINQNIFIKDKLTGKTQKVNNASAAYQLQKGTYTDRFVLTFSAEEDAVLGNEEEILIKDTNIYTDNKNNQIVISKNGEIEINNVELFNILGKKVSLWNIKEQNTTYQFVIKNQLPMGVYIVKMNTNKGLINKKVVIE